MGSRSDWEQHVRGALALRQGSCVLADGEKVTSVAKVNGKHTRLISQMRYMTHLSATDVTIGGKIPGFSRCEMAIKLLGC